MRALAAFALGEIESAAGATPLLEAAQKAKESAEVRARAVEALGKIAAALPKSDEARAKMIGDLILKVLEDERRNPKPNRALVLLGLTAALRARPAERRPRRRAFSQLSGRARTRRRREHARAPALKGRMAQLRALAK